METKKRTRYKFENSYIDGITKKYNLDSKFIEKDNNSIIVLSHEIQFNIENIINGKIIKKTPKYPYDKKIFYYIKVPKTGLTYQELFKQIDKQAIEYRKYIKNDDRIIIDKIYKKNDVEYELCCGNLEFLGKQRIRVHSIDDD